MMMFDVVPSDVMHVETFTHVQHMHQDRFPHALKIGTTECKTAIASSCGTLAANVETARAPSKTAAVRF